LLVLLGAHPVLHISKRRVKKLGPISGCQIIGFLLIFIYVFSAGFFTITKEEV
jgi:hypothetical protein